MAGWPERFNPFSRLIGPEGYEKDIVDSATALRKIDRFFPLAGPTQRAQDIDLPIFQPLHALRPGTHGPFQLPARISAQPLKKLHNIALIVSIAVDAKIALAYEYSHAHRFNRIRLAGRACTGKEKQQRQRKKKRRVSPLLHFLPLSGGFDVNRRSKQYQYYSTPRFLSMFLVGFLLKSGVFAPVPNPKTSIDESA